MLIWGWLLLLVMLFEVEFHYSYKTLGATKLLHIRFFCRSSQSRPRSSTPSLRHACHGRSTFTRDPRMFTFNIFAAFSKFSKSHRTTFQLTLTLLGKKKPRIASLARSSRNTRSRSSATSSRSCCLQILPCWPTAVMSLTWSRITNLLQPNWRTCGKRLSTISCT